MRADVIIVGAGLAGSAAAWELTRRGQDVVVLEAFEPGHQRGSSHGSARIFRRAYPDPLYVTLSGVARRLWHELEDEAGEELIRVTGAVDFGPPPDPEKMHEILTAQHVPAELLTGAEAAERWPGITFDPRHPVLFHPEGGVIDADRAVAAMQRLATQRGADIRHNTAVTGIEADGTVRTAGAEFTAPVVVVAAGAWLEPLLGHLVRLPPLVVTQVDVFHFAPAGAGATAGASAAVGGLASGPTWICTEGPSMYGLPSGADSPGAVKVGAHYLRTVTTGDDRDSLINTAIRDQVLQFVRAKINGLSSTPVAELTCLYTSTTSEDFILDRRGPFVVASVCSGHGAKFAPLTGRIVADLADGTKGPVSPHRRFSLDARVAELPGTFPTQAASLLAGVLHRP